MRAKRYGVSPDLSCYGKALGNGMPVSAVGGSWAAMRPFEEIFFSGTHGGEALSLAAAVAVLDTVADGRVLAGIAELGATMLSGMTAIVDRAGVASVLTVGGEPCRTVVGFGGADPLILRSWVQQCMLEAGVLFNGSMFISARHSAADISRALDAFAVACAGIADGGDLGGRLRGDPVAAVFRAP